MPDPQIRNTSGSATSIEGRSSPSAAGKTYLSASISRKFLRLSGVPPSQYWKLSRLRASCAFSTGRYLRTVGSVFSSEHRVLETSAAGPFLFFMKPAMALLLCPS